MFPDSNTIAASDPALWAAIQSEFRRYPGALTLFSEHERAHRQDVDIT